MPTPQTKRQDITPAGMLNTSIMDVFRVDSKFHREFLQDVLTVEQRLQRAESVIMQRKFRAQVGELIGVVEAIRHSCEVDPDDVREETDLPVLLKAVASALESYVEFVSNGEAGCEKDEGLRAVSEMVEKAIETRKALLVRMQENDSAPAASRTRVVSAVFDALLKKDKRDEK